MGMTVSKTYEKNIACLECLWEGNLENRVSVAPMIDLIAKLNGVGFTHLTCNTRKEFEFNLRELRNSHKKKERSILYLAFHGKPGRILLSDGDVLTLEELAEVMGTKFKDWIVHFGTCSTLATKESRLRNFLNSTEVSLLVGFRKAVDWAESTSMDLILLDWMECYKNMRCMQNKVLSKYKDLVSITGLRFYPPSRDGKRKGK